MPRVKRGVTSKRRHKKILKLAEGFYGRKKNLWTRATEQVQKGWQASFKGRKLRKRQFRTLWIARINSACRENGISYSKFISGMIKAGITLNRKQLAEMCVTDAPSFLKLIDIAKENVLVAPK
jgi:large subunit ribosomal protein L20